MTYWHALHVTFGTPARRWSGGQGNGNVSAQTCESDGTLGICACGSGEAGVIDATLPDSGTDASPDSSSSDATILDAAAETFGREAQDVNDAAVGDASGPDVTVADATLDSPVGNGADDSSLDSPAGEATTSGSDAVAGGCPSATCPTVGPGPTDLAADNCSGAVPVIVGTGAYSFTMTNEHSDYLLGCAPNYPNRRDVVFAICNAEYSSLTLSVTDPVQGHAYTVALAGQCGAWQGAGAGGADLGCDLLTQLRPTQRLTSASASSCRECTTSWSKGTRMDRAR